MTTYESGGAGTSCTGNRHYIDIPLDLSRPTLLRDGGLVAQDPPPDRPPIPPPVRAGDAPVLGGTWP